MIEFLFSIPLWLLAVILNVWLMTVALGGICIVRRYVLPRMRLATMMPTTRRLWCNRQCCSTD